MNILCTETELILREEDVDMMAAASCVFEAVYSSLDRAQKEEIDNFLNAKSKDGKEITFITYINLFNNYAQRNGFPFRWYKRWDDNWELCFCNEGDSTHVDKDKLEKVLRAFAQFADNIAYFGWFDEWYDAHTYILEDGYLVGEHVKIDFLNGRLG